VTMTALRLTTLLALLTLMASTTRGAEQPDPINEHIASLITDIDSYVSWPAAKAVENEPFFVAVLGESSLAAWIKELNRKELPDGRKIKVRMVRRDLLPSNAHIVLVAAADDEFDARTLEKLKGTGTLTITIGDVNLPTILRVDTVETAGKVEVRTTLDMQLAADEKLDIKKKLENLAEIVGAPTND